MAVSNLSPDDAVIVAARRSPIGKRRGQFASLHPHDLLGQVQSSVLADKGIDPAHLDMIVTGCVTQIGEQAYNVGRMASLASGIPIEVPSMTLDAQCGSSHQAVNVAAGLIRSGAASAVLASGVEMMSRIPLGSAQVDEFGTPYSDSYRARFEVVNQGESAERIADRWGIGRRECDEWGARSQQLAGAAARSGRFAEEIVPIMVGEDMVNRDEGIRPTSVDTLADLTSPFRADGRHTAGNSSQISDGAAAVLILSRARAEAEGLSPLARIAAQSFVGVDPVLKLTGPIPATAQLLERAGMSIDDIDRIEVSEAFAAVVLAWFKETGADPDRVNVNGGAIALGHPVGASGARMIATAAHELARSGLEYALVTMCCGGGLGTATLLAAES